MRANDLILWLDLVTTCLAPCDGLVAKVNAQEALVTDAKTMYKFTPEIMCSTILINI